MTSLHYYFLEFNSGRQSITHRFGTDRVAAFANHRQLEKQGKKLSAVQTQKQSVVKAKEYELEKSRKLSKDDRLALV